nr:MAG TPA: hypothetical protein [Caudoviricetes sp.]
MEVGVIILLNLLRRSLLKKVCCQIYQKVLIIL